MEACDELTLGQEPDVDALPDSAVAQCLSEVALAGTTGADDQDWRLLVEIAAGGQVVDQAAIQARQTLKGEILQGLVTPEAGLAQEGLKLLLVPPGDLVLQQKGQELGVG